MQLYFVTSNENKVREVKDIIGFEIERVDLDIKEIQSIETEEVIKDKAFRAYEIVKNPVMVEDTGLHVEAWKGFPGALSKWVLNTLENEGWCKALQGENRRAWAKSLFCIYNGRDYKIFTGEIKGTITTKPRGTGGFGWDPIFQPEGYNRTFGEMSQEEKNKISMRKIALIKMKKFFNRNSEFLQEKKDLLKL